MSFQDQVLFAYYGPLLVALSVLISVLGAYAARNLADRTSDARGRAWLVWLAVGAIVDGIGTWSMHFTGMLALRLPIPELYDWPTVLLSYLVGVIGSAASLSVLTRGKITWARNLVAAILLGGIGISGLHYTAMSAMRFQAMEYYSPPFVLLSVISAIVISFIALSMYSLFRQDSRGQRFRNHGSPVVRGMANPIMHYTAMAGVMFMYSRQFPDLSHAVDISSLGILGISIIPAMVLVVGLLTTVVDRVQKQRVLLDQLFEQAPEAVALLTADNRVVRVNREFTRLFGYTPGEVRGQRLLDLIVPGESHDENRSYLEQVAQGRRVEAEGLLQHKDASRLNVSMVLVPVSVPGGQVEIYAIYRDISARRHSQAERERLFDQVREGRERLQILSNQLISAQETERRAIARELHDEIGQVLFAVNANLQAIELSPDASVLAERLEESTALVDDALRKVRDLSLDLRPSMLDDFGLVSALEWFIARLAERSGLEAEFEVEPEDMRLPPGLETTVFRVAQVGLTNVARHAHAKNVKVVLRRKESVLELIITDDGVGFDVPAALERAEDGATLGLLSLQERVRLAGGEVEINSAPGKGTEIRATFPLTERTQ